MREWSLRTHWPLVLAAALLSFVWLLPLLLGYYGIVDPGLVYRASPAEASSTPWGQLSAGDASTISTFARVLGVAVIAIAVVGLLVTWWPMLQGRTFAIVAVLAVSLVVLAFGAYLHRAGYWNVWPLWLVALTWGAGALSAGIWLARERRGLTDPHGNRRRAGRTG